MSEEKDLVNITRFDRKIYGKAPQHGWWVRLQKNRVKHQHFFNDKFYGGEIEGLKAAKIFRDAVKLQLDATLAKSKSRTDSGIAGVVREYGPYQSKGHTYNRNNWRASWIDESGIHKAKSFAIDEHGEEVAFRKALNARNKGIAFKEHKTITQFKTPQNVNQKIWRYLDFTKFVSLLENKHLYFSSVNDFNDPFEGSFSKINKIFRPLINKAKCDTPEMMSEQVIEFRKKIYVNCWHLNDYESAAMWELYSKSDESVCIQSTFKEYSSQLSGKANVGEVQYINYNDDYIPEHDPYLVFLYKRKSFEHEQELRGLIKSEDNTKSGININIDIEKLIHKVYISPSAPKWFYELIEQIVKRYGYDFEVCQSSLLDEPFF